MALNKTLIEVPLAGGIQQKEDEFGTNGLTTAQNMVMNKTGKMSKRHGYTDMPTDSVNATGITANPSVVGGSAIYSYDDKLIVAGKDLLYDADVGFVAADPWFDGTASNSLSGDSLFSYIESTDEWKNDPLGYNQVSISLDTIARASTENRDPVMVEHDGIGIYAYTSAEETTTVSFVDVESGNLINEISGLDGIAPRVFMMTDNNDDYFVSILCHYTFGGVPSNNAVKIHSLAFADITSATSVYSSSLNFGTTMDYWDVTKITRAAGEYDELWISHMEQDPYDNLGYTRARYNGYQIQQSFGSLQGVLSIGNSSVTNDAGVRQHYTIYVDSTDNKIKLDIYSDDFSTVSTVDIATSVGYVINHARLIRDKDGDNLAIGDGKAGTGTMRLIYSYHTASEDWEHKIITQLFDFNGLYIAGSGISRSNLSIRTEPVLDRHGVVNIILNHSQPTQKTNFLVTFVNNEISPTFRSNARMIYGRAQSAREAYSNGSIFVRDTNELVVPMAYQDKLLSDDEVLMSIKRVVINKEPDPMVSIDIGSAMLIGGASPVSWDGADSLDYGFNWYPGYASETALTSTIGGVLSDGTYYYKFIYEATDMAGNLYRSYPSAQVEVVLTGGTSTQKVALECAALPLTAVRYNKISAIMYRTEEGGGNYQRVKSALNNTGYRITFFDDSTTDADLLNNELLYTTGGILGDITIPPTEIMASKLGKVFVVPMDDPNTIRYSKDKVAGLALEFPEEFQVRIDEGGAITGLATMDDKVVIFKRDKIFYFQGTGPNALGSGLFSPTYPIAVDVGCVDKNSIIQIALGIIFKSEKGIYLLGRDSSTKYIGASVEDFNQYSIKRAVLVDDQNQIRYTLDGGQPTLVYDYYHNIWTTFTNHNAVDACMHNNKYHWLGANGEVHVEDSTFTDGNFVIPAIIETAWVKSGSLQSFLRVYRMELIGKYRSKHTLKVDVYLDYNETDVVHTFEFNASTNYVQGQPLQFVGRLSKKCESIKFKVYDDDLQDTYESFELTAIGLEIGLKKGLYKQPKTKKI